jgi:hypothetical protein
MEETLLLDSAAIPNNLDDITLVVVIEYDAKRRRRCRRHLEASRSERQ